MIIQINWPAGLTICIRYRNVRLRAGLSIIPSIYNFPRDTALRNCLARLCLLLFPFVSFNLLPIHFLAAGHARGPASFHSIN